VKNAARGVRRSVFIPACTQSQNSLTAPPPS
jgi:hypothetical protein